ncbi:hypothetical protein [uncultured Tessaracoccus sp.]|uniref:hypothetical protein n=1 Tax=uncultured Tessaracoccus sp. TaxID=905023 RepID=UPI0025D748A0|nr:hypothetical protein [uncultured Tessaracoccus sp.]
MDFIVLMFIVFLIIGPLAGYQRYNQRRIGPGQPPQELYGGMPSADPYGHQPYGAAQGFGAQQPISAEAFNASKDALADDITTYGTELRDLDLDVVGKDLTPEAREDYTRALDAYDGAKTTLDRTQYVDDLKRVAEILEEGRFSVASVRARVDGKPLPQRRPPCFFDPAHGPSVDDVLWAPAGGAPRKVPACARDAQRVSLGADPSIRMVGMPGQLQPYWENQAYVPYAQGYYSRYDMDPTMRNLAQSAIMFGGLGLLFGMFGD